MRKCEPKIGIIVKQRVETPFDQEPVALLPVARQREGIVKSIGKSATELAEERKRKREESRKNKKAAQVAAAKAKKKGKNKKAEKKPKGGREKEHGQKATPMSKAKTFTLSE